MAYCMQTSYFDLSNNRSIKGTIAQLSTNEYLPTDSTGVPVGKLETFPRKVTEPFVLDPDDKQFDNGFVVEPDPSKVALDTRTQPLKLLAQFSNPDTHLHLEIHSTEPAFQFYSGEFIDVPAVGGAPALGKCAGFAIEPSRYVNAVNVPEWRSMCLLKKGKLYGCKNVYKAWKQ